MKCETLIDKPSRGRSRLLNENGGVARDGNVAGQSIDVRATSMIRVSEGEQIEKKREKWVDGQRYLYRCFEGKGANFCTSFFVLFFALAMNALSSENHAVDRRKRKVREVYGTYLLHIDYNGTQSSCCVQ